MKLLVTVGSYERILYGLEVNKSLDKLDQSVKIAFAIPAHTASIRCVSMSTKFLATGGADEQIRLFDLINRKDIGSLSQHQGTVQTLVFIYEAIDNPIMSSSNSSDGSNAAQKRGKFSHHNTNATHLLSAGEDGRISLFRTSDWECLHVLRHKYPVTGLAVHPSAKLALSVGLNKSLRVWDLMTGKQAFSSVTLLQSEPIAVSFSPDGQHYAVLSDFSLHVFTILSDKTKSPLISEFKSTSKLTSFTFYNPKNRSLSTRNIAFLAGEGSAIQIIDFLTGSLIHTFETGIKPRIKGLAFHRDSSIIVAGGSSGQIMAWEVLNEEAIKFSDPILTHDCSLRITCIAIQ